jgi:hypothetical protein
MGILYTAKEVHEWMQFVGGLRERNRYVPANEGYFTDLINGCLERREVLPPGTSLFRSRVMPLEQSTGYEPLPVEQMGPPPARVATAGRLNPEGISCLYAALEEDTAVSEVRPWTGARLTVAEFKTIDPLEVLDLTHAFLPGGGPKSLRQKLLSVMIAQPIHREDRWAYLGTQYLAETLKAKGVLGVMYASSLREGGKNVAIFSTLSLHATSTKLVEINAVSYSYRAPSPPQTR